MATTSTPVISVGLSRHGMQTVAMHAHVYRASVPRPPRIPAEAARAYSPFLGPVQRWLVQFVIRSGDKPGFRPVRRSLFRSAPPIHGGFALLFNSIAQSTFYGSTHSAVQTPAMKNFLCPRKLDRSMMHQY
jgi:hypothetical protein